MAENLGNGVSFVNDPTGYAHDTVVFQKGKPPLDSELNLVQQISHEITRRGFSSVPSGWLTFKDFKTSPLLANSFYSQDPTSPIPEYALVNGMVVHVTNSNTSATNLNVIKLGDPPTTANELNGVYLEVWRALLDPNSNLTNGVAVKPEAGVTIDNFLSVDAVDVNHAWIVGQNGVILQTANGGQSWSSQFINTPNNLNSIFTVSLNIAWVIGDNGTIGRTTNGGQTWNLVNSGRTENFKSIFALSQLIGWLVGDAGTILHTTNGVTWLSQNSGVNDDLRSVSFLSSGIVGWAAGANGTILKTVDAGSHWLRLTSGTTANLNSIIFFDANFGFAAGEGGTILRSSDGGSTWINQSANILPLPTTLPVTYTDISLAPNLDQTVNGEDVSSQADSSNKVFTVLNTPITKGDGKGQTFSFTAMPPSVNDARPIVDVKVDGVSVAVDSVNGTTGQIILHDAPISCVSVKVYYSYKVSSSLFNGKVWITGTNDGSQGVVLRSEDLGATWVKQVPNTGLDVNGIFMIDKDHGWIVANSSIIRHTISGGKFTVGDLTSGWVDQLSSVLAHQQQRVFYEGNNPQAGLFLNDDSINPNANIETTKRVQIQYAIRVFSNVDPFNFPEAGLGAEAILGLGPNSSGTFHFENMGPVTGDYGLWRAKCLNTVDGFTYAIPMCFVNRRNTVDYNAQTNANGQTNFLTVLINGANIRPDQLIAVNVVDSDILDVRRRIAVPSITELLDVNMDELLSNTLHTRLILDTVGGDKYGTQILQVDRVAGSDTDGGTLLVSATLSDAVQGKISSGILLSPVNNPSAIPQNDSTSNMKLDLLVGFILHQNPAYYSANYISSVPDRNRSPIPGAFTNIGTTQATFTPNIGATTATASSDPTLQYLIGSLEIVKNAETLTQIPSSPQLVKNYSISGASGQAIYYQGIFENQTTGKIIEQWDSGLSGISNYSIAFPGSNAISATTTIMASTVELHYFVKADSSNIVDPTTLNIDPTKLGPNSSNLYTILTISQVRNVTAGFTYKISNVTIQSSLIQIKTAAGFNFVSGSIFEIVAKVLTTKGDKNVRNGATVNFSDSEKKISTFCVSDKLVIAGRSPTDPVQMNLSNGSFGSSLIGTIIGVSHAERVPLSGEPGILLPFCWVDPTNGSDSNNVLGQMYPITNIVISGSSVSFDIVASTPIAATQVTVTLQVLVLQTTSLIYNTSAGLLIGYYYNPSQSVSELPSTLTVEMISNPEEIMISDLGTGGSLFEKDPYVQPLAHIPVNDGAVQNDDQFYNVEPMRFPDFSVDGGFVQLPALVPGSVGTLIFSNPTKDLQGRSYYGSCSKEMIFRTEGLLIGAPRKIFIGAIGRIQNSQDSRFMNDEYVLIIFSRNALLDTNNYTGFINGDNSVIAIYRLPNRPMIRR